MSTLLITERNYGWRAEDPSWAHRRSACVPRTRRSPLSAPRGPTKLYRSASIGRPPCALHFSVFERKVFGEFVLRACLRHYICRLLAARFLVWFGLVRVGSCVCVCVFYLFVSVSVSVSFFHMTQWRARGVDTVEGARPRLLAQTEKQTATALKPLIPFNI